MDALGLVHNFPNLPVTTRIIDIFTHIIEQLRQKYNIPLPNPSPLPLHERMPLILLAFTNRGRATGAHKTPKLTTAFFRDTTTVLDLLSANDIAIPKWAVMPNRHIQINIREHLPHLRISLSEFNIVCLI